MSTHSFQAPTEPGFAQFSVTLREAMAGRLSADEVAEHLDNLELSLELARDRLSALEIPKRIANSLLPARQKAELLLEKLGLVVDLVDDYLQDGGGEALDEALSILDIVQGQFQPAY